MPEFDVAVLVPIGMRIRAKDAEAARANSPHIVAGLVSIKHKIAGATIPLSTTPVAEPAPVWDETRIDIIGQNGNDGEHY